MSLSSSALYNAVASDVQDYLVDDFRRWVPSELTYKQFASCSLLDGVIRKWIPSDTTEPDAAAYNAFIRANNLCKDWKLPDLNLIDEMILSEIRKDLDEFFHPGGDLLVSSYYDIFRCSRPGPGVVNGPKGTSLYEKFFSGPLTSTSDVLYDLYKGYIEWIPFFSDADCQRYEEFGPHRIVSGSRCTFVPKTAKISRMVCIEPSLNIFAQLGLATILTERLRSSFGIDLETQPRVNMRLACDGSKSGKFCTIDLSSASDSISLRLCETLLPKWFFELLLLLRSRTTEINGQQHALFMMSTMGNGFTFPLQTIIFTSILRAVHRVLLPSEPYKGNLSCFGDDLICRREIYDRVVHILNIFGFSVNVTKSFSEGPFRESCGADWFFGQPVRPVYIRRLSSLHDLFTAVNLFNEWSAYTGIPLRNTVRLLLSKIRRIPYVPFDEGNDRGIRVPLSVLGRRRYDKNLSLLYWRYEPIPFRFSISEGKIRLPRGAHRRTLAYNPCGLYVSFLFGELVSMSISVRHNTVRYRGRYVCTPRWDYIPCDSLSNGVRLSWQQWETAVLTNVSNPE